MNQRLLSIAILAASLLPLITASGSLAAPLRVDASPNAKGSNIDARVGVTNLGHLRVPQGRVILDGNQILVRAVPEWLFDSHTVLSGRVVQSKVSTSEGTTRISGVAYFMEGEWLNSLDNFKRKDSIETVNGEVLVGRVRGINADSVDFQTNEGKIQRVPASDIQVFESPRAFVFSIIAGSVRIDATTGELKGEADTIAFNPTVEGRSRGFFRKKKIEEPKSTLAGTEGGVTKSQIAGMVALDVVNTLAPIIVAPIVAPIGADPARKRLDRFAQEEAILERQGEIILP